MSPNPSLKGILNGVGRKRENWKELDGNYSSLNKFKSPPNAKNIQGSLVSCKPMNAGNTLCLLLPILTLVVPSRKKSYRQCSYSCIKASQIQVLLSSICNSPIVPVFTDWWSKPRLCTEVPWCCQRWRYEMWVLRHKYNEGPYDTGNLPRTLEPITSCPFWGEAPDTQAWQGGLGGLTHDCTASSNLLHSPPTSTPKYTRLFEYFISKNLVKIIHAHERKLNDTEGNRGKQ